MNDKASGAAAAQRAASQVPDAWADAAARLPGSAAAPSGGRGLPSSGSGTEDVDKGDSKKARTNAIGT